MTKTCGNCGRVAGAHLECHIPSEKYVWVPKFTRPDSEPCEHWIEAKDTLEQRYQQLEQVARDLFNRIFDFNKNKSYFGGVDISDFRKRLEELGVEL